MLQQSWSVAGCYVLSLPLYTPLEAGLPGKAVDQLIQVRMWLSQTKLNEQQRLLNSVNDIVHDSVYKLAFQRLEQSAFACIREAIPESRHGSGQFANLLPTASR